MCSCSKLSFYFNKNDPNFKTTEIVPQNQPYIGHWFITAPIYDSNNKQIGYKATDDYIQQVSENKYLVRYFNTYFIDNMGSISWEYSAINSQPNPYYPNGTIKAKITSGTGKFVSVNGYVNLTSSADGKRDILITYK
jgi:hypothetical protein